MPDKSFAEIVIPLKILVITTCFYANQLPAKEYIIKVKYDAKRYSINSFDRSGNLLFKIVDIEKNLRLLKVDTRRHDSSFEQIAELTEYFDADYVVENILLHAFVNPTDPRRTEQWALDVINAKDAWDISWGSHEVIVAVIDTGIDFNHEDLRSNRWVNKNEIPDNGVDDDKNDYIDDVNGWDFKGNDRNPTDETGIQNPGHGTHCAGVIGADCGNNLGICGISPTVSLMALRFLGSDGSGDLFSSVKAIQYAANNGAHIISASWGATIPQEGAQPIIDAIKSAEEKGVIFVAAAGNDGKSNDRKGIYPANAQTPHMIAVAASNREDKKPSWSNYGRKVDIASPGEDILSTVPGDYKELSGTSMATPLVAGLVALMKSLDKNLTGATARSILQSFGKEVDIETESKRRIDAHEALKAVAQRKLTLVPAAHTLLLNERFSFSAWGGLAPYRFSSLNPNIATIDETGQLVAVSEGDVSVEVFDARGNSAQSVSIKVIKEAPAESTCPFPNEFLCLILCGISPSLPWCKDLPDFPDLPEFPEWPGLPLP